MTNEFQEDIAASRRARRVKLLRRSRMRRRFAFSKYHSRRIGYRNVGTNTSAPLFIGPRYYKRTPSSNYFLHNAVSSRRTYKFGGEFRGNPYRFVSSHDRMVRQLPLPPELQRHVSKYLPAVDREITYPSSNRYITPRPWRDEL